MIEPDEQIDLDVRWHVCATVPGEILVNVTDVLLALDATDGPERLRVALIDLIAADEQGRLR